MIPAPGPAIDALVDPARGLFDAPGRLAEAVGGGGRGGVPEGGGALAAGLRFRPAEAGGRRVRQLVEMPFEFVLGGR